MRSSCDITVQSPTPSCSTLNADEINLTTRFLTYNSILAKWPSASREKFVIMEQIREGLGEDYSVIEVVGGSLEGDA